MAASKVPTADRGRHPGFPPVKGSDGGLPLRQHGRDSKPAKTQGEGRQAQRGNGYVFKNNKLWSW